MKEAASEMGEDALSGRYWARGEVREEEEEEGEMEKKSQALTRRIQIENEIESTRGNKNWKDRNYIPNCSNE